MKSGQKKSKNECSGCGWELETQGDLGKAGKNPLLHQFLGDHTFKWTRAKATLKKKKKKALFLLVLNPAKPLRLWIRHSGDSSGSWPWLHISLPRKYKTPMRWPHPQRRRGCLRTAFYTANTHRDYNDTCRLHENFLK